ncbi:MAG: peptidoglycan DD-metalloendopeptidase family protein [Gammaproteobacteria bacterium]|nr:peptidoglycan DD-metalloendopeptidase family protein [Gammaproteobacteria bacterium]
MFRSAVFCALLATVPADAAQEGVPAEGEKLEQVRERIRDVQSGIAAARDEAEALQLELQQAEAAAAGLRAQLEEVERDAGDRERRLTELRRQAEEQQRLLTRESGRLGRQIRIAYMAGREDYLKLLLNQEDPALVGRMLAYHDYFNRARLRKIQSIGRSMDDLARVQVEIQDESARLDVLRQQQLVKLGELDRYRQSRRDIIARIHAHISDQDRDLRRLRKNERELSSLLNRIHERKPAVAEFEEQTPFASLKGRLSWPLQGRVITPFGALRKGGRMRSQGVTLAAAAGQDVHAVSDGRVVFADWFRNLGLLLIVDHGSGYMSLYGHNEALLKKAGDLVSAGEVIGRAGDTGGADESALYFEIRRDGAPQDPTLWCSR